MNNEQFRKFVATSSSAGTSNGPGQDSSKPFAKPALGSRLKSIVPMTPRSIKGHTVQSEFSRQVSEQKTAIGKAKTVKTSVPKGTKLAAGYVDRTKERNDDAHDERAKRIKALEDSMRLGQIDEHTFERLRDEITGGDANATHLVKGLDRKLLERIRRGEDITQKPDVTAAIDEEAAGDLDEEFDNLARQEVAPIVREDQVKQGTVAARKLTRDEILAEFKAQRLAAKASSKAAPRQLGPGFRKVGGPRPDNVRMEIDNKGREVMIVTDADGNVKRKVRKGENLAAGRLLEVDESVEKLGMTVEGAPEAPAPQGWNEEGSDNDIFDDVPEYDPLAGLDESEDDDEAAQSDRDILSKEPNDVIKADSSEPVSSQSPPQTAPAAREKPSAGSRNYFNDDPSTFSVLSNATNPLNDPSVLANLAAKTRQIDPARFGDGENSKSEDKDARLKRKAEMLAGRDRDMDDMDMGFGGSRFEDAEDIENDAGGRKDRLSNWRGLDAEHGDDDDDDGSPGAKTGKKRKRGANKKKGNKNDANDVLRVMEAQKKR